MRDEELMDTHDFIQWLFPLTEPSQFNVAAPILTEKQIHLFREDRRLQRNLVSSFQRFMRVFGLQYTHGEIQQVVERDIWMHLNHNWLRFTRILRSLTILGRPDEAMAFLRFLERKIGNVDSMIYWRRAVGLGSNRI